MAVINSLIDLVHPTVSGLSVLTNDRVWVLFDREIDETSITGSFFISGPDQDRYGGPANAVWKDYESIGSEGEVLQSPGYGGIVTGTITTEKIQNSSLSVYTGKDYTGNGTLWRTKAIFTPTKSLSPDTEYIVYVSGDEDITDDIDTGIKTRTVFDTVQGSNLGSGVGTFTGGYTGDNSDIYYAEITTSGIELSSVRFQWWKDSDLATVYGPLRAKEAGVILSDGVTLSFSQGSYVLGDDYNVVVKTPTVFLGNLTWPFETGSGSIQTVPATASTTLTGAPVTTTTTTSSSSTFSVSSTSPADQATNLTLPTADYVVAITFNDTVDGATVLAARVKVETEAVNGDDSGITHSGVLTTTFTTSGSTLNITIPSGLLFKNNVVTVTLDDAIASTSGVTLGTDYTLYFTTQYDPLYSSVRKLRLEIGAFISSVPDDTLNFAIFEASLEADALTWNKSVATSDYYNFVRRQFTTCKAAEILLLNAGGVSFGLAGKKLGDLAVTYNPKVMQDMLNKTLACLGKWLPALQGGGYAIQEPSMFVKGDMDPDRPPIGRGWESDIEIDKTPISNSKSINASSSRRWKNGYYSRWGK